MSSPVLKAAAAVEPEPEPFLSALHRDGFVKVPSLLTPDEVALLRAACRRATDAARAGDWPYIRTLPKQFPPWPSRPGPEGIWGVQHLLHPDMPDRERNLFAASYFKPALLQVVQEILGVGADAGATTPQEPENGHELKEEPLVLELYNLLVRPESDFELRWHRDDIPPTASAADEEAALGIAGGMKKARHYSHTQWNLALEKDDSLIVVPETHRRARTQVEREAGFHDALPGQIVVHLEPGDVVFYDNDILHRGRYDAGRERFTLHGSIGKKGWAQKRARNVLQHGVGQWIADCHFDGLESATKLRAQAMKENLVEMGSDSSRQVLYSQVD